MMFMFKMEFETANAAFSGGDYRHEIARIFNEQRDRILDNYSSGVVYDVNGNKIGRWTLTLPLEQE